LVEPRRYLEVRKFARATGWGLGAMMRIVAARILGAIGIIHRS